MRRRLPVVLVLAVLVNAPLFVACIFDDGGDYQGGGRRTASGTSTATTDPEPSPTSTLTSTPRRDAAVTPTDAGDDG